MTAYAGSYLVGALVSYSLLRRVVGGLDTPLLVRFLVRLAAGGRRWRPRSRGRVKQGLQAVWPPTGGNVQALAVLVVTGLVDVGVFLALARAMRIREVTGVMNLVTGRLRR